MVLKSSPSWWFCSMAAASADGSMSGGGPNRSGRRAVSAVCRMSNARTNCLRVCSSVVIDGAVWPSTLAVAASSAAAVTSANRCPRSMTSSIMHQHRSGERCWSSEKSSDIAGDVGAKRSGAELEKGYFRFVRLIIEAVVGNQGLRKCIDLIVISPLWESSAFVDERLCPVVFVRVGDMQPSL